MDKIDLYDIDKNPTGRVDTHPKNGEYRLVIHLCIFKDDKMLIQKRSEACQKWAGLWDLTLSGCAIAGEKGRDAAMRELYEELGLELDLTGIRPDLCVSFATGFDEVFLIEQDVDISSLSLQSEEVCDVKWATLPEILSLREMGEFTPFAPEYLKLLFFMKDKHDVME
ncbi:MAG: NUDIX domain-containing protein [Oscillospiraceae bacterium]|nr:NUDIX domain-containing protein [Oscillospiraceae bacterium]